MRSNSNFVLNVVAEFAEFGNPLTTENVHYEDAIHI